MEGGFTAPGNDSSSLISSGRMGSLERAVVGDYEISIRDVLGEAWNRTSGVKGNFWMACLYMSGLFAIGGILGYILSSLPGIGTAGKVIKPVIDLMLQLFVGPVLGAGLYMMGVHRAVDKPVDPATIFRFFHKGLSLALVSVIYLGLIFLGLLFFILPGLYLAVAYSYAPFLVVDKDLKPWQALETSRKAITKRWFTFFFMGLVSLGLMALSAVPLGLGLIWTMPWCLIAWGVTYRTVFGVERKTLEVAP